ncbi:MAG TPA: hypothetical protein VGJ20_17985 [Xanthobacteraceae bacterium]|jgi:hypothetical protein
MVGRFGDEDSSVSTRHNLFRAMTPGATQVGAGAALILGGLLLLSAP